MTRAKTKAKTRAKSDVSKGAKKKQELHPALQANRDRLKRGEPLSPRTKASVAKLARAAKKKAG